MPKVIKNLKHPRIRNLQKKSSSMDSLKERGKKTLQTSMQEVGAVKFDTCVAGFFLFFFLAPKLVDPTLLLGH